MAWIKTMCRICLDQNNSNKSCDIYTSICEESKISYSEMLATCTKIKPNERDGLPRKICPPCCKNLEQTFVFNAQCEESNRVLATYLGNLPENLDTFKYEVNVKPETECLVGVNKKEDDSKHKFKLEPQFDNNDDISAWNAEDNLSLPDFKTQSQEITKDQTDKNSSKRKKHVTKKTGSKKGSSKDAPKSKGPHQCDTCGKFYSSKGNLRQHQVCHAELKPYKCKLCPSSFRWHSALFLHKRKHTGEKPYHCEYCSKQFSRKTGLINHVMIHTGEKQFSCSFCLKKFIQVGQLNIHMKRHQGIKPFLCQECGKGFPLKTDLVVHSRVHNGEKPYSCQLCGKAFASAGSLSLHIRFHNKDIRYRCSECDRGFVSSSTYNLHMKRHRGQKDHVCECGKEFYTSTALREHRYVHTGEKNHHCKICNRQFSLSSHLSRHFKKVHGKPDVPLASGKDLKSVMKQNALSQPMLETSAK